MHHKGCGRDHEPITTIRNASQKEEISLMRRYDIFPVNLLSYHSTRDLLTLS